MDSRGKETEHCTSGISIYQDLDFPAYFQPIHSSTDKLENRNRYIIVYIGEGDGVISYKNRSFTYEGPCVLTINHDTEELHWIQARKNRGYLFYFHPMLINSLFSFHELEKDLNPHFSTSDNRDKFLLESFLKEKSLPVKCYTLETMLQERMEFLGERIEAVLIHQETHQWPCFTRSYLIEMLLTLQMMDGSHPDGPEKHIPEEMKEIQIYIHSHYNQPLTLDSLVKRFHTNRTTLTEKFRRAFQMPVKQYILQLRLEVAKSLLSKTELSIQEISHRVGFPDPSHFSRRFQEKLSCSPGKYRKGNR